MSKSPRSGGGAGQIRIIGGQWRGRKLPVPDSAGLRPTTDRVRETLFNWLAPDLPQARCLDCFAGSGALGLEALSRYAGSVTLLERNQWLSADALIYVESEVEQGAPDVPASWQLYREKIAGQVAYRLYQRQQEAHDVA